MRDVVIVEACRTAAGKLAVLRYSAGSLPALSFKAYSTEVN